MRRAHTHCTCAAADLPSLWPADGARDAATAADAGADTDEAAHAAADAGPAVAADPDGDGDGPAVACAFASCSSSGTRLATRESCRDSASPPAVEACEGAVAGTSGAVGRLSGADNRVWVAREERCVEAAGGALWVYRKRVTSGQKRLVFQHWYSHLTVRMACGGWCALMAETSRRAPAGAGGEYWR